MRAREKAMRDGYANFIETMTAINGHMGYQFTQPIMEAVKVLSVAEGLAEENCGSCKHFEVEEDTNGIYRRCNHDNWLYGEVLDEDYCSRWEAVGKESE